MATVRSLRVSVKSDSGSDHSVSDSDSESERDVREAEPMEVEEGELEAEDISVNRSLKELLPVSARIRPPQTGGWRPLRSPDPREASCVVTWTPGSLSGNGCQLRGRQELTLWLRFNTKPLNVTSF